MRRIRWSLVLVVSLLSVFVQPGRSQAPEPTDRIVVKVGQTRTAGFTRQPGQVDPPASSDAGIATARFTSDDTVVVSGHTIGQARITIRGTIARYQAGANVPLRDDRPFQVVLLVDVVPATSSDADAFYQDAKSLLDFTVTSLEATRVRWSAKYLNKIPEDVGGRIADHLRAAKDASSRLTRNYDWLKKGTVRQDEFFRVGFDLVRTGIKTAWQADLDDAGYGVQLVSKTYQKTAGELSRTWFTDKAMLPPERQRAERPRFVDGEAQALTQALRAYAAIAQQAAARHRVQMREGSRWYRRAAALRLAGQVRSMEAFLHEQFTYGLARALSGAERTRLFAGMAPDYSTLDFFVNVSGSPDRLATTTTFIENAQATSAGAPYRDLVWFNWDTSPGLFKMDPAFRNQKVELGASTSAAAPADADKVIIDPDRGADAPPDVPPSTGGAPPSPGAPSPGSTPPGSTPPADDPGKTTPPRTGEDPGLPLPPFRPPVKPGDTRPEPPRDTPKPTPAATPACTPQPLEDTGPPMETLISFTQITLRASGVAASPELNTPPGLVNSEPYFVDLWVDREQAATLGRTVDVTFLVPYTGKTASLRLNSDRAAARGLVLYTAEQPFTLSRGGEGGGRFTVLGFEFSTGGMSPLPVDDGDTLVVSYKEATTEAPVYQSIEKMRIAFARESFRTMRALYDGLLQDPKIKADATRQRYLRDQLRMLLNADILTARDYDPSNSLYTDYMRLHVAQGYLRLAGTDPRESSGPAGAVGDVHFTSVEEQRMFQAAREATDDQISRRSFKSLVTLTVDLSDAYIEATGVERWTIVLTGSDIHGKPVDAKTQLGAAAKMVIGYALGRIAADTIRAELRPLPPSGGPPSRLRPRLAQPRTRAVAGAGVAASEERAAALDRAAATPGRPLMPRAVQVVAGPRQTPSQAGLFGENLQKGETTCGLMVARSCIRDAHGMAPAELELVNTAAKKGLYNPNQGMTRRMLSGFMRLQGAETRVATGNVSLGQVAKQILKGRQVAVMVRPDGVGAHWVRVYDVAAHCDGLGRVRFGDPWNGQVWEVDGVTFSRYMIPSSAVSIDWPR